MPRCQHRQWVGRGQESHNTLLWTALSKGKYSAGSEEEWQGGTTESAGVVLEVG